jgi:hypothetical protein
MARSIALPHGFAGTHTPTPITAPRRTIFSRITDWLSRSQQQDVEREIDSYVAERGFDHFTDSIERDIECRFLARHPDRF